MSSRIRTLIRSRRAGRGVRCPTVGGELVTVMFADAEGSTELFVERGDDAGRAALERVLAVVRTRAEDYGGRYVKSLGDGCMLTFPSPRQAVACAVAVQRTLAGTRPAIRLGINTGEVSGPTDDPVGEAVSAAARIAAKAPGGEVFVSDVVRQLVGTVPGISFADRGRSRLKGFPDPWRLFAALDRGVGPDPAPVFGRAPELHAIADLLDRLDLGDGGVLVIEGEGGIGKTHLAEAARRRARARGVRVVWGRAEELETDDPGLLLLAWADALSLSRPALLGELDPGDGRSGLALAAAIGEAIDEAAAAGPVLLVAEDLHWADGPSLRGVASLVRRVGPLPVALIATMRSVPRPPLLDRVLLGLPERATRQLRLGGLDDVAITAIASAQSGAPPGPILSSRLATAAGNPLYVVEILRALDDDGRLRVHGGVAEIDDGDLPGGLRETVVRRLSWLPPETVELLRLASLLGREFTLADLAIIAGRRVVDVAASLQPAVEAAILAGEGDTLSFRHDVLREAIYDQTAPAIRRDLHAAAGRALAAAGAPAPKVARHLGLGARRGDRVAVEWIERAAAEAAHVDVTAAVSLFERALELADDDPEGSRRIQLALLEPLGAAGRVDDALRLGRRLLDRGLEPPDELAVRCGLAAVAASSGDLGAAVTEAASAAAIDGVPAAEAARIRALEASMAFLLGRGADEVRAVADEALAVAAAVPPGDGSLRCTAHQALAFVEGAAGCFEVSLAHARAASGELARRPLARAGFLIPEIWEGTVLLALDRFDEAAETWAVQQRRAEQRGHFTLLVQTHTAMALLQHLAANWADGLSELETALAVSDEYGNHAQDVGINALFAWRALAMAEPAAARDALAAGDEALSRGRHLMGVDAFLLVKSRAAVAAGQEREAYDLLGAAWDLVAHVRGLSQYRLFAGDLVKAALAAGDASRARGVVEAAAEIAARTSAPSAHATALRVRGLADDDPGALREAVAVYRESPRRWELALACEDAGRSLLAGGDDQEGVALLDEAAQIHGSCGAVTDVARVDATLRGFGIRRRRRRPATALAGWEALSPTEAKVAELIALGRSNPQIAATLFVSRRTVETHVSHILRKLGVANRTELAAEAVRRGPRE